MENQYFATKPAKDTIAVLMQKSKDHYNRLHSNQYLDKLRLMWRAYHGIYGDYNDSHQISFVGEQGELVNLTVNHFRNIALHIFNMITSNRPIMEAKAVNTDFKSMAQTYLASSILDYYMREKNLENALKTAVEYAVVLGSGFIRIEWNETSGRPAGEDELGNPIYEGDLEFTNLSPFDVVFDGTKNSWSHDWLEVRTRKNKYDLMAKYPELAEKIQEKSTISQSFGVNYSLFSNDSTDDIFIYEFFHKPTESVPEGRYILFIDEDAILIDQPLPYKNIPIYRIAAGEILGTPYAYGPMFDLYPLQEAINSTYSTILTNQHAFGVTNVYIPRGADIAINTLQGGLNVIEANAAPVPVNLTQTPKEIFSFLDILKNAQEILSGISSVTRGDPSANLRSASALALVQSMSIQYISPLNQSYVKLIEDVGSAIIEILKQYARSPKIITLVGKYNKSYLKEFTGEDLNAINRVVVDVGNPLSRTIAGRMQLAEQMLQMGLIKNPEQFYQVMNTGRIDSAFEGNMSELLNIKKENEALMTGQFAKALHWDSHRMHILEHRSVLADPELRANEDVVRAVNEHVQEHIDLLRLIDPDVLMLLGEQPLTPMDQMLNMPQPGLPQAPLPSDLQQIPNNGMNINQMVEEQAYQGSNNPVTVMPEMPKPPAPFENLPVLPGDK